MTARPARSLPPSVRSPVGVCIGGAHLSDPCASAASIFDESFLDAAGEVRQAMAVAALVDRMTAADCAENRAAGARLMAISELDLVRLRERGEQATFAPDTHAQIAGEVAAALQIQISRH